MEIHNNADSHGGGGRKWSNASISQGMLKIVSNSQKVGRVKDDSSLELMWWEEGPVDTLSLDFLLFKLQMNTFLLNHLVCGTFLW